jgi:hypothetical protein
MKPATAGVLLLVALRITLAATPASAVETPNQLFEEALAATGDDYLAIRDRLVAGGEPARAFLAEMKASETWQERLLAEILLERMEHGDGIRVAVAAGTPYSNPFARARRIRSTGWDLAKHFKPFPLVLVEFLWKGNELATIENSGLEKYPGPRYPLRDSGEGEACAARALAVLKEKRALPVLLVLMGRGNDTARIQAGKAIGDLGAPVVLKELLRVGEQTLDRTARVAAWYAIRGCARPASIPVLRRAAMDTQDAGFRESLEFVIERLERPDQVEAAVEASDPEEFWRAEDLPKVVLRGPGAKGASSEAVPEKKPKGVLLGVVAGMVAGGLLAGAVAWLVVRRRRASAQPPAARR